MSLSLGVDTGGTYTDAVLIENESKVVATAKALTTRHDLSQGIGQAVEAVLQSGAIGPEHVTMASLSTTLATNALIEGQGERVGLVLAGFSEKDVQRHGLAKALGDDPLLHIQGGHDHAGNPLAALDEPTLRAWLVGHADSVAGFAVATQFATRNTAHETTIAKIIQSVGGKPVSCSHHLSAKLNGPKRALTAVLNARLIGMIDRLITQAQRRLTAMGIHAPLMVVRGDGALISADFALERPIETILSGPAASIVGARWMTGASDALVSDIGGTTTDVAVLRNGRPAIDPQGAQVGAFRTMVEAVAMRTTGLGGDSEVHVIADGLAGGVRLGPKRVLPVSLMALTAPELVHDVLDAQLRADTLSEHAARFVTVVQGVQRAGLQPKDNELLDRIGKGVQPLGSILRTRREHSILRRLIDRGLVQISGVTPSDASHVMGTTTTWDTQAAQKALDLMRRSVTGAGQKLAPSARDLAQMIVDQLTEQTALALLETAFAEEADPFGLPAHDLARHVLMQRGLRRHKGLVRLDAGLNLPVVGLGASAPTYYPAVGKRLSCEMILPQHAGVANAIGAVVGRVTIRRSGTITSPSDGVFRVHLDTGPQDFAQADRALNALEQILRDGVEQAASQAGAEGVRVVADRDVRTAKIEGSDIFVEATITVEASGRPRIAG